MKVIKFLLTGMAAFHFTVSNAQTNIFPAVGNVGIGTTTPTAKLTVLSATNVIGFSHTNGTVKLGSLLNSNGAFFGTITNHPLHLRTNNSAGQFTLLQNGNVGIGTTNPIGKLEVKDGDAFIHGLRIGIGGTTGDTTTGNTCLGKNALLRNSDSAWEDLLPWAGRGNTAIGAQALTKNINGGYNTAIGAGVLAANVYGDMNTALGAYSQTRSIGTNNTSVGTFSLTDNINGNNNAAFGYSSLEYNTSGAENVAIGNSSLNRNSTASYNTAIGTNAMYYNSTGTLNSAVGNKSLTANTTGAENAAVGANSMLTNTTGYNNTAAGSSALRYNTSGYNNTAAGKNALYFNMTGMQNTATGVYSLYGNSSGNYNTANGRYALFSNTTGADNTAVGDIALYYTTTGSYNSAIGYFASPNAGALSNTTSLGYGARTTANNQARIGNSSVLSIGGYVNWTNISDSRVKTNIKQNVPGLTFINQLKPVTYNLTLNEVDKIINEAPLDKDIKNEKRDNVALTAARVDKEKIVYTGFIAQEVEKAAQSINYDFSGVDAPKNNKDLYGLRYAEFVVPLVKSVQELSRLNDEKDAKINDMQKQLDELKELITGKKTIATSQNEIMSSAVLEQNIPNPFSNSTQVAYTLPSHATNSKIILSDKSGKVIKELMLVGKGKGNITINTSTLSAGVYQYSLYVNNTFIATRQMNLIR